ncbi:MAG: homoserine dehydrogenase [Pseudomonadota bacterium]
MTTIRLGIAGLGHVGCGLIDLVAKQRQLRLPGTLSISAITARTKDKPRSVDISSYKWAASPVEVATDPDVDVFVELIGGSDGPAKEAVEAALKAGKPVVTANKALIAAHGQSLGVLAEAGNVDLLFEAAVAGGIPIVRVLRDSLAGIMVDRISGILNGTCNFLLSEMLATGRAYSDVLAEAQRLGYAEADPYLDVSGMDAAHKAAILSAIAFSADLDFDKVAVSGVDSITLLDLQLADRLGYRIKLIAEGKLEGGKVVCRVETKALEKAHPLAGVDGSLNMVHVEGDPVGAVTLTGPGAGAGPTASAVMGDIAKIFRPGVRPPFGRADHHVRRTFSEVSDEERSSWFLRVRLADKSGAIASLSEALAQHKVSIDKLLQDSAGSDGAAPLAIVTHQTTRQEIERALEMPAAKDVIVGDVQLVRIETAD